MFSKSSKGGRSSSDSPATSAPASGPSSALVMLMAAGAGLGAASLYYSQPMLGSLSADLGVSYREIGWIPTLTQLGYALGILLLIPLGDRHDRRQIILIKSVLLALALVAGACSHSLGVLLAVSLAIGLLATVAQDIVPAAATLAPENRRGKIVGSVMTGLLLGILLSRVISGVVGEVFGWRVMFGLAACWVLVVGCVLGRSLPNFKSTTTLSYAALLGSLADLWRRHPVLRQVAVAQGLLSMGFSAFWSTLAVMLHAAPFHLGSAVAGSFGLAGAAGALAAPIAGHLADRRGPGVVSRLGAAITTVFFLFLCLATLLPPTAQLWALAIGAVGFDLGVQVALISHQTIVYGIEPAARSRLNAVLFVGMFIGMAAGSAIGSQLLAQFGWAAVTCFACAGAALALLIRMWAGTVELRGEAHQRV